MALKGELLHIMSTLVAGYEIITMASLIRRHVREFEDLQQSRVRCKSRVAMFMGFYDSFLLKG